METVTRTGKVLRNWDGGMDDREIAKIIPNHGRNLCPRMVEIFEKLLKKLVIRWHLMNGT